ncbi:MAG: hypothetical protein ACREYE_29415, partial [Gammaproteobacteria bacterium]
AGQIAVLSRTVLARILRLDRRTGISAKEDLTAPPQTCRKDTAYRRALLERGSIESSRKRSERTSPGSLSSASKRANPPRIWCVKRGLRVCPST